MNNTIELFIPALIVLLTAIGSVIILSASRLILADEGTYHLGNVPYSFNDVNYQGALLTGGFLGLMLLYIIPQTLSGETILHWLPMMLISLFTAQSVIDLKYFELADEWTSLIGLLALMWRMMNGGLTWTHVGFSVILYLFFFIGWFFIDFPGYGDVKLVLAGGVLLSSWSGVYWFILFTSAYASIDTLFHCWITKKPANEWMTTRFAFGPHLSMGLMLAMIGMF